MSSEKQCTTLEASDTRSKLSSAALDILNASKMPSAVSIGIELEFFLRNKSTNKLCELDESQLFLTELSALSGWNIFSRNTLSGAILRVSRQLSDGRYHSVKYEHPPYMMEVAIAHEADLLNLKESLCAITDELNSAADRANLAVIIAPSVEYTSIPWDVISQIDSKYEDLSHSRRVIYESCNSLHFDHRLDFPAYTAATQFHIGGFRWWEQSKTFVERIYRSEFLISGLAYKGDLRLFLERWANYAYVFGSMPLLGFPKFEHWSFSSWLGGLLDAPYFLSGSSRFGDAIKTMSSDELRREVIALRDLQIVKPKWIGTLEFRADPATNDLNLIMRMAAMRLAAYLIALSARSKPILAKTSFLQLSSQWWQGKHLTDYKNEVTILEEGCYSELRSRKLGEETLL